MWGSITGRGKRRFLLQKSRLALGPPSLLLKGYQGSFQDIERLGHEVDLLHARSAEVKNEWSCISALSSMPSWFEQGQLYTFLTYICTNLSKVINVL
jgi:hypothetical protein